MADFQIDEHAVRKLLREARERARTAEVAAIVERARGGAGLAPEEIAVFWLARGLDVAALYELAREVRRLHPAPLETFSPLYLTNTCDADCRMCGMRRDNRALERRTAGDAEVAEQLRTLRARGMRGVALVTGEYRRAGRASAIDYVHRALLATQEIGFEHVLLNVGSLDDHEIAALLEGITRRSDGRVAPDLTVSTFQETYSREIYARFMGADPENPRADFERRLTNFDRARRAGMRAANPGVLLGLDPDLAFELVAFAMHARHLLGLGMEVYLSVPRLRRVAGGPSPRGISDEDFVRLVALLSLALPTCKVVITTREPRDMQHRLVPIARVLSAGSAAVAPYTADGARFPLEESQFEVTDQRPFELVLEEHRRPGAAIVNYEPPAAAPG